MDPLLDCTYSNEPFPRHFDIEDAMREMAAFISKHERFRKAESELRRIDFWGTGALWCESTEKLIEQLAGRQPLFHAEALLEPGTIFWTREGLPWVFVAPDVYERLRRIG